MCWYAHRNPSVKCTAAFAAHLADTQQHCSYTHNFNIQLIIHPFPSGRLSVQVLLNLASCWLCRTWQLKLQTWIMCCPCRHYHTRFGGMFAAVTRRIGRSRQSQWAFWEFSSSGWTNLSWQLTAVCIACVNLHIYETAPEKRAVGVCFCVYSVSQVHYLAVELPGTADIDYTSMLSDCVKTGSYLFHFKPEDESWMLKPKPWGSLWRVTDT